MCGGTRRPLQLATPRRGLTFPSCLLPSRLLESWWGGWAWPGAATPSRCTSSEGPRSEPWLGVLSWPTCSPGLRSKCPAPAPLSLNPSAFRLRSVPVQTFIERQLLALHSHVCWFTGGPCLRAVCRPVSRRPKHLAPPPVWSRPSSHPRQRRPAPGSGSRFCPASSPSLFCSLAAEEAGVDDSADSGWRLCLRLHGPLHPEGLSPDGHELPFLFEQVNISGVHAPQKTPLSLNPSLSGPSHLTVTATSQEA